jgi:hypothetical protein
LGLLDAKASGLELKGSDWICPTCAQSFLRPGKCPKHGVKLISFEEFAEAERSGGPFITAAAIALILVILGMFFLMS